MAEQREQETSEWVLWRDDVTNLGRVEFKAGSASANRTELEAKVGQALATNIAYLAIVSPNNAQNATQIKALTRQCNALIRLLLGALDDTAGI